MKNRTFLIAFPVLALLFSSLTLAVPAQAEGGTDYLAGGIGIYNFLGGDKATDFRLEYRSGETYFRYLQPWAGVEFTTDGSVWGGGGILVDIPVTERFYLIPSIGVGLYAMGSSGKDLDCPVQFRSQLEGGYEFENNHRLGLAFGHMSNSSFNDKNPGTEILNLYWHVPY